MATSGGRPSTTAPARNGCRTPIARRVRGRQAAIEQGRGPRDLLGGHRPACVREPGQLLELVGGLPAEQGRDGHAGGWLRARWSPPALHEDRVAAAPGRDRRRAGRAQLRAVPAGHGVRPRPRRAARARRLPLRPALRQHGPGARIGAAYRDHEHDPAGEAARTPRVPGRLTGHHQRTARRVRRFARPLAIRSASPRSRQPCRALEGEEWHPDEGRKAAPP